MTMSSSEYDFASAVWHKSSYSGGDGGDCLEAVTDHPDAVPVRDSKATGGPVLVFRTTTWSFFITSLKRS
ncbi:DUF397 domain-containing protein [Streptomyces sp. NBC_00178]|uniref:DUF397 domain-containing protein n=1 Tax=Streptomyces sp. NBC_00178 TaxID=2975672 RepID=UPI002E2B7098|nr:DUF397 domain-containing protein [Streptomyces sp. NBC_00178]